MTILWEYIVGLYYGIMLRDYITGLYYGIILQICHELSYEKDPGDPRGVPGAPWDLQGPPGTPLGTAQGRSWDPPGIPGTPMDHKNGHVSTNLQRQKLSIAASE